MRNIKELAKEAITIQDACNLSGLVHGWSRSITELREIMPATGTEAINRHPINKLRASKLLELSGAGLAGGEAYEEALKWCEQHANSASPQT